MSVPTIIPAGYLGDIRANQTLTFFFNSYLDGVRTDITSFTVKVYGGNFPTTSGITISSVGSIGGAYSVAINTSVGGHYTPGSDFIISVGQGTISGNDVTDTVLGYFSIEHRSALLPTLAGRTLDVSATGEAGLDWANIGSYAVTVNLSGTSFSGISGNVGGNVVGSVGSLAGGTVTLDATQASYAPAKAGDAMSLTGGYQSTLITALNGALSSAHGSGSWLGSGSSLTGPNTVTLTFVDANARPVALVDFVLEGIGTGRSGVDGTLTFGLANGTYSVIARSVGTLFPRQSFTVSGTSAATITGIAFDSTMFSGQISW